MYEVIDKFPLMSMSNQHHYNRNSIYDFLVVHLTYMSTYVERNVRSQ